MTEKNYFASEAEKADAQNRKEKLKKDLMQLTAHEHGARIATPRQNHAYWLLSISILEIDKEMTKALAAEDIPHFNALETKARFEMNTFQLPAFDEADLKYEEVADIWMHIPPMFAHLRPNNLKAATFEEFSELAKLYKEMIYHEACSPGRKRQAADEAIDQSMLDCLGSVIMGASIQLKNRDLVQMKALREQFDLILDAHHWEMLKPKPSKLNKLKRVK